MAWLIKIVIRSANAQDFEKKIVWSLKVPLNSILIDIFSVPMTDKG